MGYQRQYQNLDSIETKLAAVNDLIRYMGKGRAKILIRYARTRAATFDGLAFYAGLGGVEGFPVQALWEYVQTEGFTIGETRTTTRRR